MPIYLTDEERALQLEKSREMRKHFEDFCEDAAAPFKEGEVGLLISGGIDSTMLLFSMLARGVRPHLYTFIVQDFPKNSDVRRVRHIAEHFDLPLSVVEMPEGDSDLPAQFARWELNEDWRLSSRPDIEVGFFYDVLAAQAAKEGIKALFCGLDPVNLFTSYLIARERIARVGGIPNGEHQAWRMVDQSTNGQVDQYLAFGSNIFKRHGLFLVCPQFFVTYTGVLDNIPWHICQREKDRAIGTAAFAEEYAELNQNAVGVSMLKGDTGGRDYFEKHITQSKFANKFMRQRALLDPKVQVEGFSSTMFYNQLKKEREELQEQEAFEEALDDEIEEIDDSETTPSVPMSNVHLSVEQSRATWTFLRSNEPDGTPLPDDFEHPWNIVNGEIVDDDEDEPVHEESAALFSDLISVTEDEDEEEYDDGIDMSDKRIDCWGRPIRETPLTADCPRARAGLCGHEDGGGFDSEACSLSAQRIRMFITSAQSVVEQCFDNDPELTGVAQKWVSKCRDLLMQKVKIGEAEKALSKRLLEHSQENARTPFNPEELTTLS